VITTETLWLLMLFVGVGFFISGTLLMFSRRFRRVWHRSAKTDEEYEELFSEKQKHFLERYYDGMRCVTAGGGLIAMYWVTHQQLFAAVGAWLVRAL
jgi:hypothetical protein